MDNIHRILDVLHSTKEKAVLCTITQVEGSAYRKAGTSMLFLEDGTQVGVLSAGCLEGDLSARVDGILNQGRPEIIAFDMRSEDDFSWGQGAGCNGMIHVLLEPVDSILHTHLQTLHNSLRTGKSVLMAKKITRDYRVSDYLFLTEDQFLFGQWQGPVPIQALNLFWQTDLSRFQSGVRYMKEVSASVYIQCFHPKPRLFIFGAGPDAIPLAKLAAETGFSVKVSDWRPALCNRINFPNTDELIIGFPVEVMKKIDFTLLDFVIILTHSFERDKELLNELSTKKLRYVGVLGTSSRTIRLLEGKEMPANVHSPVGLPIGAEGPEEIAVSILAELIMIQRKHEKERRQSIETARNHRNLPCSRPEQPHGEK